MQLGTGPCLQLPLEYPLCPCPVQAGWAEGMEAEWRWLTQAPGAVVPHGSADTGAGGVVESDKGWAGMTAARQGLSEGWETR